MLIFHFIYDIMNAKALAYTQTERSNISVFQQEVLHMNSGKLHKDHRQRMRRRFLVTSGRGFSDHELLEMLLFGSVPRANTNPTAHMLLDRFGSISDVLSADPEELRKIKGVGESSVRLIMLMGEACSRYMKAAPPPTVFTSS